MSLYFWTTRWPGSHLCEGLLSQGSGVTRFSGYQRGITDGADGLLCHEVYVLLIFTFYCIPIRNIIDITNSTYLLSCLWGCMKRSNTCFQWTNRTYNTWICEGIESRDDGFQIALLLCECGWCPHLLTAITLIVHEWRYRGISSWRNTTSHCRPMSKARSMGPQVLGIFCQ
jgi:hypothetical protein